MTIPDEAVELAIRALICAEGFDPDSSKAWDGEGWTSREAWLAHCRDTARAVVEAAGESIAAAERERLAAYITRAAARKREQAETWFSSDALIANAWDEVAGWCRDETIWTDGGDRNCPDFPECREERYVSDLLASVKAGESVGQWVSGCRACEALAKADTR